MKSLLEPAPISRTEAIEHCREHLRAQSRLYRVFLWMFPESREHLIALMAWVDELIRAGEVPGPAAQQQGEAKHTPGKASFVRGQEPGDKAKEEDPEGGAEDRHTNAYPNVPGPSPAMLCSGSAPPR